MKLAFFTFLLLLHTLVGFAQWTELPQTITPTFVNSSVAYNGKIYFTGGPQTQAVTTTIYNNKLHILDMATGTITIANGGLSVGRAAMMCVAYGGKIYFAGGYRWVATGAGLQPYDVVDIYDIPSGTWSTKKLSVARGEGAAVVLDGKIMFAGGASVLTGIAPVKTVDIYDPATDKWTVAFLSQARGGLSAAVVGKKVWFCGGYTSFSVIGGSDRVDIYDADTQQWSQTSLSQAREGSTAVAVGKYVVCAGGATAAAGQTDRVDIFDTTTGSSSTASLSAPRGYMAGATLGTKAYFTGGGHLTPNYYFDKSSNVVDIFDAQTGLWSTDNLNKNRIAHTCATWGNQIVVAGGWRAEQTQTTGSVEVFTDPAIVAAKDVASERLHCAVYPNPTSDILYVDILDPNVANGAIDLRLFDGTGNLVAQKIGESVNGHGFIKVGMLEAGTYFLETSINERLYTAQPVLIRRN